MQERKREKRGTGLLTPAVLFLMSALGGLLLFLRGGLLQRLLWQPNVSAALELTLICALLAGIYCFLVRERAGHAADAECFRRDTRRLGIAFLLLAALVFAEVYLHRLLLPFLGSGIYFALLAGVLFVLCAGVRKVNSVKIQKKNAFARISTEFTEKISHTRARFAVVGESGRCIQGAGALPAGSGEGRGVCASMMHRVLSWLAAPDGRYWLKLTMCALPFLLVQLNRMNLAFDYDSLRYGLRSQFVLAGGSFFDSLGQVNTVYTYPKGLELLTLPLAHFRCFSLMVCFQFWTLVACLFAAAALTRRLSGSERRAAQSFLILSAVCGLTNMAVTAKTDLITLLFQLLMALCFLQGRPLLATAAAVLTLAFKPTALVFSSAAWASMAGVQLWRRYVSGGCRKRAAQTFLEKDENSRSVAGGLASEKGSAAGTTRNREEKKARGAGVAALVAALFFTGFIWLRTLLITGMPSTSVFTSVWELLGFQAKWPYNFSPIPSEGIDLGLLGGLAKLAQRLLLFLFCPLGTDMEHVLMAWGGPLMPVLLYLVLRNAGHFVAETGQCGVCSIDAFVFGKGACAGKRAALSAGEHTEEQASLSEDVYAEKCAALSDSGAKENWAGSENRQNLRLQFFVLYAVITLGSLASLYLLWQVDGNYYMLWYALTVIGALGCGGDVINATESTRVESVNGALSCGDFAEVARHASLECRSARLLRMMLGVLLLFSLPLTLLTGWAGAVGFTPVQLLNRGYYDNLSEIRGYQAESGSLEIWERLSADPQNRVIAFSDAPECYYFACNVQSYTDIEGSGGNVRLVKTLNDFKEFLSWADTDYIYFETAYLSRPESSRAQSLLHDLIEDGTLTELWVEGVSSGQMAGEEAATQEQQAGNLCVYGRIDKARAAQPWQVPLSEQDALRAQEMLALYASLGK